MGDTSRDTQGVGGGGGGEGGVREILAVVTQSDLSRSHVSWWEGGGGIIQGGGGYVICSPVAMGDTSRDTQGGGDPSRSYAERS